MLHEEGLKLMKCDDVSTYIVMLLFLNSQVLAVLSLVFYCSLSWVYPVDYVLSSDPVTSGPVIFVLILSSKSVIDQSAFTASNQWGLRADMDPSVFKLSYLESI